MKWYKQNYIARRDWVLDNLELLGLDPNQTIVILLIDFLKENNYSVSLELLSKKTGFKEEEIDRIVSTLCAKKYLEIRVSNKQVEFSLDGLFETDIAREERVLDSSLYDTFESEFGRTLSSKEMEKIAQWNGHYDKKLILYALREASAYQHMSFPYIEKILTEWKAKGLTANKIEKGISQ